MGGTKSNPAGTLADVVLMEAEELEECPEYLSDSEAAALPLTGLTAWRAFFTKSGNAKAGHNILVTGIGGGVALMVLLFAVAQGCNVYVTSGNQEKIDKAKQLGAKGGVSYKEEGWEKKLQALLPSDRKWIDAIVDGAGGDVVSKGSRILKVGIPVFHSGRISRESDCCLGRRRHLSLRHDRLPHDALPDGRCTAQHRGQGLDHGLQEGVCGHGRVCEADEAEAGCEQVGAWAGYRSYQRAFRGHEERESVWEAGCYAGQGGWKQAIDGKR